VQNKDLVAMEIFFNENDVYAFYFHSYLHDIALSPLAGDFEKSFESCLKKIFHYA